MTQHLRGPLTVVVIAAALSACSTLPELEKAAALPLPKPPTHEQINVTDIEQSAPSRDRVSQDDNNLALIDELRTRLTQAQAQLEAKQQELDQLRTETASSRESEAKLVSDRERLEKLLQGALSREKDLEDVLLKTRIEVVQARQEIYRQKIKDLGTRGDE